MTVLITDGGEERRPGQRAGGRCLAICQLLGWKIGMGELAATRTW
jgi:hypothetical protein